MRQSVIVIFLIAVASTGMAQQNGEVSETETFTMQWGDSTVVMQKYFIVFLKSGPQRSQSEEEAAKIQERHLAHMSKMFHEGKTSISGPFADDGAIRGIVVYNTATIEEARALAGEDPAVKAGRLVVEVHPWWAAKGSKLK